MTVTDLVNCSDQFAGKGFTVKAATLCGFVGSTMTERPQSLSCSFTSGKFEPPAFLR